MSHREKTTNSRTRRGGVRSLRRALDRALELYNRGHSVLGFGIGFKESRHKKLRGLPCIRFSVVRKTNRPPKGERIPKRIRMGRGALRVDVHTDVTSSRVWHQHALSCALDRQPGHRGVPSFLARTALGRRFLVTAGHVFAINGAFAPVDPEPVIVGPDSRRLGIVAPRLTYTTWPMSSVLKGMFIDVGVASLTAAQFNEIQRLFDEAGRPQITGVVSRDGFIDAVAGSVPPEYTVYGRNVPFDAAFESVTLAGTTTEVDIGGVTTRTYAPMLVESSGRNGTFCPGDSGAPLIDASGVLWGVHILGERICNSSGCALAAQSILEFLSTMLDESVAVV